MTAYRELEPKEFGAAFTEAIRHGIFMTTLGPDGPNTMYLNWGSIGYHWRRYCCTVYVRPSRYTAELLAKQPEFTLTLPNTPALREALRYCGRHSGRDGDKFAAAGLTPAAAALGDVPVIAGDNLVHFVCRALSVRATTPDELEPDIYDFFYAAEPENAHRAYLAEIRLAYSS